MRWSSPGWHIPTAFRPRTTALGRVGLIVRSYTDQRAALSWAAHHTFQVACAVLHIQLADCKRADHDLIETCAGLQIPTVVLQLVPPGFNPSDAIRRAMEERSALCRKLGVAVASELNKAQAVLLEEVSRKYEFGGNGQLQRMPTPKEKMPVWKPPRADNNNNKLPPVNGACLGGSCASAKVVPRTLGVVIRGQYHLAPSNRGAGTVRQLVLLSALLRTLHLRHSNRRPPRCCRCLCSH